MPNGADEDVVPGAKKTGFFFNFHMVMASWWPRANHGVQARFVFYVLRTTRHTRSNTLDCIGGLADLILLFPTEPHHTQHSIQHNTLLCFCGSCCLLDNPSYSQPSREQPVSHYCQVSQPKVSNQKRIRQATNRHWHWHEELDKQTKGSN